MNKKILFVIFVVGLSLLFIAKERVMARVQQSIISEDISIEVQKNSTSLVTLKPQIFAQEETIIPLGNKKPKNLNVKINSGQISKKDYKIFKSSDHYYLKFKQKPTSQDIEINFTLPNSIFINGNFEVFQWSVLKADNAINNIRASIGLPEELNPEEVSANIFSSQSVTNTKAVISQEGKIFLQANYLPPQADLTLLLRWEKGIIPMNPIRQWITAQGSLKLTIWGVVGIFLPICAFLYMIYQIKKSKRKNQVPEPTGTINYPPSYLIPAEVGILMRKKIYPKDIVATIVDLAIKGYLLIGENNGNIILRKRKNLDAKLSTWEKNLFSELFNGIDNSVTDTELSQQTANSLSDPDVVRLFQDIYCEVTSRGLFENNPHLVRVQTKVIGIFFYLLALSLMVWILISGSSSLYLLPIGGILAAGIMIIKFASKISSYSDLGISEKQKWLQFKNWLCLKEPLSIESSAEGLFFTYLPYAIVLNCVPEWMHRFRMQAIAIPDWYSSHQISEASDFNSNVIPVISDISQKLSSLHGPAVS